MKKNNVGIWEPGKTVYNFGDPPEYAYLIVDGIVEFFSEKDVLLGHAGTSEVFGEISCYLNKKHSVTAKAKTNLVAKKIPKLEFTKIIKNAHPVIMGMLRSTYHRLSESNTKSNDYEDEIKRYTLMYENSIANKEDIKNKIDTIKEKLDKNIIENESNENEW